MSLSVLKDKLKAIREPLELPPRKTRVMYSAGFALLGTVLGIFSKWLDNLAIDDSVWWQRIIGILDLGNVFSGMAVWLVIALAVAVFSRTAARAAVNVLLFFAGMCLSYHIWTLLFSGFDPGSYMLIWYAITLVSPLLAAACWYAKGTKPASIAISVLILAVLSIYCFSVGPVYFYFLNVINTLLFIAAAAILYKTPKQTAIIAAGGIVLSVILSSVFPTALAFAR